MTPPIGQGRLGIMGGPAVVDKPIAAGSPAAGGCLKGAQTLRSSAGNSTETPAG